MPRLTSLLRTLIRSFQPLEKRRTSRRIRLESLEPRYALTGLPPVANDDFFFIDVNGFSGQILAVNNDSDDGLHDSLVIKQVNNRLITESIFDEVPLDDIELGVGNLFLEAGHRSFRFELTSSLPGTASFTYQITDDGVTLSDPAATPESATAEGGEFIGLGESLWSAPEGVTARLSAIVKALETSL